MNQTPNTGGPAQQPSPSPGLRRRLAKWLTWGAFFGLLSPALLYIGNDLIGGVWLPGWAGLQHLGVARLRYQVSAPEELKLNEGGTVSVAGYYIDGSSEPSESLVCTAEASPLVNGLSLSGNHDCARLASIVNDESNFPKSNAKVPLNLTLHVSRSYAWFGQRVIETTIDLLDEAQPAITAVGVPQEGRDIDVMIGSTVRFRADFKHSSPRSKLRCQWYEEGSSSNPFSPSYSDGCEEVVFEAPKTPVQDGPIFIKVGVNVADMYDHAIGNAQATIHFHLPPANFSTLVVDTSNRMKGSKFDAAAARVNQQIDSRARYGGGWLSLTGFGGDDLPKDVACSDKGVHQFYALAPFSLKDAQDAARKIVVGTGQWAPLGLAITTAGSQFAQPLLLNRINYPDNVFYFIILTGGGDTCAAGSLGATFQEIRNALTEEELRDIYFDSELLTAVIATSLSPQQSTALQQDPAYREDNRAVLFASQTTEDLVKILDDLGILANFQQPRSARIRACNNLVEHVPKEDEQGTKILLGHCAVVAQR
jgi:hypothetical protein